ncbi:hypothetical protein RchiOBHm_Chr6g0284871 [Rosa chinensis]|uniref:Uncharacterized protein n=1 Tax=Rosa chinensis TaxID=74649 RepID=A0A2P6PUD1_ROSCH|nr:hypothetical protein RchiOBHm_Chr6g0284871 [Rosa chinensis]
MMLYRLANIDAAFTDYCPPSLESLLVTTFSRSHMNLANGFCHNLLAPTHELGR